MRVAAYVLLCALICSLVVWWIYVPRRERATIKRHVKKWWWVPIIVFAVVFFLAVINSQFTLKLF